MTGFQVGPGTFITIRFQVFDAEGEAAHDAEILGCVYGMGGLIPRVERALDGRHVGDRVEIRLSEREAYGSRDPKRVVEVDRDEFPPDVSPGDRFEVENEQGGLLVLHVLDVQADVVVVDMNHPLAGQEVGVVVEIVDVRPASEEETEAALLCLKDDEMGRPVDALMPDVLRTDLLRRRPEA